MTIVPVFRWDTRHTTIRVRYYHGYDCDTGKSYLSDGVAGDHPALEADRRVARRQLITAMIQGVDHRGNQ